MGLIRKIAIVGIGYGAMKAWRNRRAEKKEAKRLATQNKRGMKPAP